MRKKFFIWQLKYIIYFIRCFGEVEKRATLLNKLELQECWGWIYGDRNKLLLFCEKGTMRVSSGQELIFYLTSPKLIAQLMIEMQSGKCYFISNIKPKIRLHQVIKLDLAHFFSCGPLITAFERVAIRHNLNTNEWIHFYESKKWLYLKIQFEVFVCMVQWQSVQNCMQIFSRKLRFWKTIQIFECKRFFFSVNKLHLKQKLAVSTCWVAWEMLHAYHASLNRSSLMCWSIFL